MSAVARFKQSDLTRAVRGVQAAGMRVGRIEIDPNTGKIVILSERTAPPAGANEWDEVLQ